MILYLSCYCFCGYTQNREIHFKDIGWEQALKMAEKQQQAVFVDCYTSWCGPCKILAKEVFTQDSVADFFNRNFVCVKMDMEKEGKPLMAKYGIRAFPTLLFIEPRSGKVQHRLVGAGKADWLMVGAKRALDSRNNLLGLSGRYAQGERQPEFMATYLGALADADLSGLRDSIMEVWFRALPDEELLTPGCWKVIDRHLDARTDPRCYCFLRLVKLYREFYKTSGQEEVDRRISIVVQNYISRYIRWEPAGGKPFDEKGHQELITCLRAFDYPPVANWLAQLYTAHHLVRQDYPGMVASIKEAMKYRFMGDFGESYYLMLFLPRLTNCEDRQLVGEVTDWLTDWLSKHPDNEFLVKLKDRLSAQ